MDFFTMLFVLGVIAGWELSKYIVRRFEFPHRWSCRECGFKVQGSDRLGFQKIKADHEARHRGVIIHWREVADQLAEALRLTREYVEPNVNLPAIEGWSWYDATVTYERAVAMDNHLITTREGL